MLKNELDLNQKKLNEILKEKTNLETEVRIEIIRFFLSIWLEKLAN